MARTWDESEPEPTPAAIMHAWSAWAAGEITFAEYLAVALAVAADPEAPE